MVLSRTSAIYRYVNINQSPSSACTSAAALLNIASHDHKHELKHLYPLLTDGGVLIIDDYGTWAGVKKAVDEYFIDSKSFRYFIDHKTIVFIKH